MKASEMTNEELAGCIESARLAPAKYVRKDDLNFHGGVSASQSSAVY